MAHQDVVTLHKQQKTNFGRNHYNIFSIDQLLEIDLCDMQAFADKNDGYRYILSVIDVFSKFAWMAPLKTAIAVTSAFKNIIDKSGRKPRNVQSDPGGEFKNATFNAFLKSRGIKQNFPFLQSLQKAAVVERYNRSIKEKMFKYFTFMGKGYRRYVDVLQELVAAYNNSVHNTIKMAPVDVSEHNLLKVYNNIKRSHKDVKAEDPKLKINDFVRIIRKKTALEHAYTEKWSREIFRVYKVIEKKPKPLYRVIDLKNKEVKGKFYEQQLQKVLLAPSRVIKIIKTRGLGKTLQYFVETVGKGTMWVNKAEYTLMKI